MSQEKIKISVVIPAFNREKTICRCLESIMNQTYPAMEILVVDDGSTDRTRNIVLDFPSDKVFLFCQSHKGAQAARNKGVIEAKGDYIAFLDSDDEWVPQMLEETVNCFLKEKDDCVIYSDCYVREEGRQRLWRLPDCERDSYDTLLRKPGPMFQSMLVKRKLLLSIGLLDEKVPAYQEWETAIRLAQRAKFVHICKPLFIYHLHEGETISKNGAKDIAGYEYVIEKHKKDMIAAWGYKGLLEHYNILIKRCIQHKSNRLYKFIVKWYGAELMFKIRGNRV